MKKPVILLLSFALALNVVSENTTPKERNDKKQIIATMMIITGTTLMVIGSTALSMVLGTLTEESGVLGMSPPEEHPSTIPNVRVFKVFNPSDEIVQGLLVHLKQFDTWMTGLGLETPPETKFFIPGSRILPSTHWGYAYLDPSSKVGGYKMIVSNAIPFTDSGIRNLQVLFHERVHTFLFHHSGGLRFYTSGYEFMKEGLADFFPHLFFHQYGENISEPLHYIERNVIQLPSLHGKTGGYDNGPIVSHLLWRVTSEIGEKEMEKFLRPLLDNLNLFHKHLGEEKTMNDHLEYILAVLKMTAQGTPHEQKIPTVLEWATSYFQLEKEGVDRIFHSLQSNFCKTTAENSTI